MASQFEALHPRGGAGRFTEKDQQDPGGAVLTGPRYCSSCEPFALREGPTHFYCGACGRNIRVNAQATDRDGKPLLPCQVEVEVAYRGLRPERVRFDAATILAGMSLDARRKLLDDAPEQLYRIATTQLLTRWTMGDVRVTNTDAVRQWVESHRDACLQGEGWREEHSDGGWITVEALGEDRWAEAAERAQEHVQAINSRGQVAVVVHNGDDFEVNPARDLDDASNHVRAAGFYATGTQHGGYASFVDGDLSTDRSATIYFPNAS